MKKAELEALCASLNDQIKEARNSARDFAEAHTEQVAENERLLKIIADPKLISLEAKDDGIDMLCLAPHWAVKILTRSFKDSLADAKNFVVLNLGNEENGHYEVTVRRYHGKSPTQLHEEEVSKLKEERNQAEQSYSDLIHLCEEVLRLYDRRSDGLEDGEEVFAVIEAIRAHVSPDDTDKKG